MSSHASFVVLAAALAAPALAALPTGAAAQASYYDLDAGRPTRIEDGVPLERYALAVFAPGAVERLDNGTLRLRVEPKLAFGAFPLTEFELRAPYIHTRPRGGAGTTAGLSGGGFGVLRALTAETRHVPAIALFGELFALSAGQEAAPLSYTLKGILTKTTVHGRLHLNVAGGTYALPAPKRPGGCTPSAAEPDCVALPQLPDPPCAVGPSPEAGISRVAAAASRAPRASRAARPWGARAARCGGQLASQQPALVDSSRGGPRWFVGLGVDRALPLRSLLISASTYVERFSGPFVSTDWAVELGVRHQLAPRTVLDAGVTRRLAGAARATGLVVGLTHGVAIRATPAATSTGAP